jgi:hypothetical protein
VLAAAFEAARCSSRFVLALGAPRWPETWTRRFGDAPEACPVCQDSALRCTSGGDGQSRCVTIPTQLPVVTSASLTLLITSLLGVPHL